MDYENMSDFEINKRVAEILFKDCIELEVFQNTYNGSAADVVSQGVHVTSFDFNNPSDAWPIIVDNKISIEFGGGACMAYDGKIEYGCCYPEIYSENKNPLRAACIVYLMMQEVGNA